MMTLGKFDPLSSSLKLVHADICMLACILFHEQDSTKDQISRVSSHDLYWEDKMYKRKRSIMIQVVNICGDGFVNDWVWFVINIHNYNVLAKFASNQTLGPSVKT